MNIDSLLTAIYVADNKNNFAFKTIDSCWVNVVSDECYEELKKGNTNCLNAIKSLHRDGEEIICRNFIRCVAGQHRSESDVFNFSWVSTGEYYAQTFFTSVSEFNKIESKHIKVREDLT